jgi:L-lactate dehydrogenase complex protein LldF
MKVDSNNFVPLSQVAIADPDLQQAVTKGTTNAYNKRLTAMFAAGQEHGELMRQQAAEARRRAIRKLPELLERAETNMKANGINVLWAESAEEVRKQVLEIVRQHDVKLVAKSKSMISEEVALNHTFEENDIEVVETDLGEFIIQINHQTPSHIIAPVIHMTKAQIRDLFVRELGMPPTDDAREMTAFARDYLRQVFLKADMGISGGNFIIAETGTLCLVTNEGNGRMITTLPRVHVAIVGFEKIIDTVEEYSTLTQLLPRSATGQNMTVYTQMLNGPRRADEPDGPEHVYVILVDNGRSNIYGTKYAEALTCIRCGACLNACPVYQVTGGHAYGWVYSGPIGAVITPLLTGLENATPLPQASSLCGKCKQVCPVDIDLPRMLLDLRADLVERGESDKQWDFGLMMWSIGNRSPHLFRFGGAVARFGTNIRPIKSLPGPLGGWTKYRDFPSFAPKSFRQLWKERQKNGKSS